MHPILFKFGPVTIYSYGTMLALAFLLIIQLVSKKAEKSNISPQIILDVSLIILISSVAGARIAFVLKNFVYYKDNLPEIILFNRGGLFFFGGLITAIITAAIYLKAKKIFIWKMADIFALYIPLGQALGRIGCFLNGCCYGKESTLPWAFLLPNQLCLAHPTQIYSSLGGVILFIILSLLYPKKKFDGEIFISYLFLYSIFRFSIEFFRGDHPVFAYYLTGSQWVCLGIFISSIIFYFLFKKNKIKSHD